MSGILAVAVLVAAFAVYGIAKTGHNRLTHHGIHAGVWRFMTGQPWHGKPVTDAGWTRRGTRALTRTGHASRWQHLTIWERTAWRTGGALVVLASLYGWFADRPVTELAWLLGGIAAAALSSWRAVRAVRRHSHRRSWAVPAPPRAAPADRLRRHRQPGAVAPGRAGPLQGHAGAPRRVRRLRA